MTLDDITADLIARCPEHGTRTDAWPECRCQAAHLAATTLAEQPAAAPLAPVREDALRQQIAARIADAGGLYENADADTLATDLLPVVCAVTAAVARRALEDFADRLAARAAGLGAEYFRVDQVAEAARRIAAEEFGAIASPGHEQSGGASCGRQMGGTCSSGDWCCNGPDDATAEHHTVDGTRYLCHRGDHYCPGSEQDVDGITVRPEEYTVTAVPDDASPDAHVWALTVRHRGGERWAVQRGEHACLGADGTWAQGVKEHDRGDDWLAEHRFDLETALRLARQAAPHVTVNGFTVADVLARRQDRTQR